MDETPRMTAQDKRNVARALRKLSKQLDREAEDDEFREWLHPHFKLPVEKRIAYLVEGRGRVTGVAKTLRNMCIEFYADQLIEKDPSKTAAFKTISKVAGIQENAVAKIYYEQKNR